jgi:hypothetical protein
MSRWANVFCLSWIVAGPCCCAELIGVGTLSGGSPVDASTDGDDHGGHGGRPDGGPSAPPALPREAQAEGSAFDGPKTPGRCAPGSGAEWVSWSSTTAPPAAYLLGGEPVMLGADAGFYSFYVCRVRDASGDLIPGKFVDTLGCFYTPDGIVEAQAAQFEVLVDPLGCLASTSYEGFLPAGAVVAGKLGGTPLYVCASSFAGETWRQVGYITNVPNSLCRISSFGNIVDLGPELYVLTSD